MNKDKSIWNQSSTELSGASKSDCGATVPGTCDVKNAGGDVFLLELDLRPLGPSQCSQPKKDR